MNIQNVSLKPYSSLRVGGEGDVAEVTSHGELIQVLMYARQAAKRVHMIGEGTNTFFGNNHAQTLFVVMKIRGISFEDTSDTTCRITVGGGERFDDVVKFSVSKSLWGIENLSLIPGTAGASPVQNIGAYGVELASVLVSLSAVDMETLNVVEISNEACQFGYRDSLFKQNPGRYCIVSITLALSKVPHPILTYKPLDTLSSHENLSPQDVRDCVIATRMSKLPDYITHPNVGSFFKNPVVSGVEGEALRSSYPEAPLILVEDGYKIPAAWLIEHVAEMKGVRMGNVGTWPAQPLIIVNYGEADAEEIQTFSESIITRIKEKSGITLEREVNFVE